jgi:hypothetical protein
MLQPRGEERLVLRAVDAGETEAGGHDLRGAPVGRARSHALGERGFDRGLDGAARRLEADAVMVARGAEAAAQDLARGAGQYRLGGAAAPIHPKQDLHTSFFHRRPLGAALNIGRGSASDNNGLFWDK